MSANISETTPDWDKLYSTAENQSGYFTTRQAAEAGYSSQLLYKHLHSGKFERARRGIYRLVHFPPEEHEELVVLWLWSDKEGVFSHQTALALHDLSDVLPSRIHMTLPESWSSRRISLPKGVEFHYSDIQANQTGWHDVIPVTSAPRTIADAIATHTPSPLIRQAIDQAQARGILTSSQTAELFKALDNREHEAHP